MKVLRQLLREFWLPLVLGMAWTVFNFVGRPRSEWNVRVVLNVLGPTFFFMSWLVAQWYRVRKQQHVESELEEIHAGVRAIHEPLLPCTIFATLKVEADEDFVRRIFKDQEGYHAYGPDQPPAPEFMVLPPGTRDGRVMRPDGYIDYTDGVPVAAGAFVMNHPGYNLIHCPIAHTVSRIHTDSPSKALLEDEPLFTPRVQLEFYLEGRPRSSKIKPTITLASGMVGGQIIRACALDHSVFVDVANTKLAPKVGAGAVWSVGRLKGSFLRVTMDFCYFKDIREYPTSTWPSLHNLQLWFGGTPKQLLTFNSDQLKNQVVRENPNPIFHSGAGSPQIVFELEVDAGVFAECLLTTA
jgi:hypothetical protein